MKVVIIGTGYVGLPTGVGLAELGNDVICVDKIEQKIADLRDGKMVIYEDGMEELFLKNIKNGRLKFSTDISESAGTADLIILAVGTPPNPVTKEADMKYIAQAAEELAPHLSGYTVIANKSTVPVGTGDMVEGIIKKVNPAADCDVVSLPEFLREGFAMYDFFNPDRIVVGTESRRARDLMEALYKPFEGNTKFLFVKRKSAEAIKYASNAFLAMKIHYINEMADFCENADADINEVAKGMGLDTRIGNKFLNAGPGFGGFCFPKDTNAMAQMAKKYGVTLSLVETTIAQNDERKRNMAKRVLGVVQNGDKIAVLGLAFKGGTDDTRESPAMDIVCEILKISSNVSVYDPKAMDNARNALGDRVAYCNSVYEAAEGASVLVILTEWEEFRNIDLEKLKGIMKDRKIVDLRNMLKADDAVKAGFEYKCIGRK